MACGRATVRTPMRRRALTGPHSVVMGTIVKPTHGKFSGAPVARGLLLAVAISN
jgi:hypothetical protein